MPEPQQDAARRTWHPWTQGLYGWTDGTRYEFQRGNAFTFPVGTRVSVEPPDHYDWTAYQKTSRTPRIEAIVLKAYRARLDHYERLPSRVGTGSVEFVSLRSVKAIEYYPWTRFERIKNLRVLEIGNGETPIPGTDYEITAEEKLEAKWALRTPEDDQYQGFHNPATWMMHLYLQQHPGFSQAVRSMADKRGRISSDKVFRFARDKAQIKLEKWVWLPPGFEAAAEYKLRRPHFRYQIDWEQISAHLSGK